MATENQDFIGREKIIKAAAEVMAGVIIGGGQLIVDMDGVFVREAGLARTEWLSDQLLPALQQFEQAGGQFGVATARTREIVKWLRDQGLQVNGKVSILANGQEVFDNGEWQALTSHNFLEFIANLDAGLVKKGILTGTWEEIGAAPEDALVLSHQRWQSPTRRTYLIKSPKIEAETDIRVKAIREISRAEGLNWDDDVFCDSYFLEQSGITILFVRAKDKGIKFDKVMAVSRFLHDKRVAFVTDFGWQDDEQMADWVREKGGVVIGIRQKSNQVLEQKSNIILNHTEELVGALNNATELLLCH